MSDVEPHPQKQQFVPGKNPVVTAYLVIAFATPFSSGSPWHVLFALCWFLLFISYVFFESKKYPFSLFGQLKGFHPVAFYLLLAFGISSLVSWLLIIFGDVSTQQKIFSSIRYVSYWIICAYVFSLARFCLVNNLDHSKIFFGYMLGAIVLVALLLLIYFLGDAPNAAAWAIHPPLGEHVRLMGMIASVALLVSVVIFLVKEENTFILQCVLLSCMLVSAAFLIWTGSRASMLLSVLTILIVAGVGKFYGLYRPYKIISIILCIGLSVWLADKFSIFEWNGIHRAVTVSTINAPLPVSGQEVVTDFDDKLTTGRINMWSITLSAVKAAPWFGLGPYGYFFIPDRPNIFDHPHNFILQFLVEWGAVGASLLLALLAYLAWQGLKNLPAAFRSRDTDFVIAASIVFIMTMTGLVDGTYFLSQPLFCLATSFAVFPFFTRKERNFMVTYIENIKITRI